jgi:hypothetical protein
MIFKFTASRIDELEKVGKRSLEQLITDTTINNIAAFIEKGVVNENGTVGCSRNVALAKIDDYLEDKNNDIEELAFIIMEALVDAGFLSRQINVQELKEVVQTKKDQAIQNI